jgi:Glycosyl transferase family 2
LVHTRTSLSVSVVIPTVSRAAVRAAVASALDQTCPPLEVIVVVDSADFSVHPALSDVSDKIRLYRTGGIGPSGARMRGAAEARGQVIAFLDDDDEWLPEKIERQLALWPAGPEARSHSLVSCSVAVTDNKGGLLKILPTRMIGTHERVASYLFRRSTIAYGEGLLHPSTIICDRALIDLEPWDPSVTRHEDWDWLLRVGGRPDVAIRMCPDVLVGVAMAGRSMSADWRSSLQWLQQRTAQLTPRERGDFLLCHTATSALRSRSRRGGLITAGQALRSGRPGLTAWLVWVLHMLSPAIVDGGAALKRRVTQGR